MGFNLMHHKVHPKHYILRAAYFDILFRFQLLMENVTAKKIVAVGVYMHMCERV